MKFILSHIFNYQNVSIAFSIIIIMISAALQELTEYSILPDMLVVNYM
jgi:flagellar biosynthesis component FlhA